MDCARVIVGEITSREALRSLHTTAQYVNFEPRSSKAEAVDNKVS